MTLHHTVNKPADFIFKCLSDTSRFIAVHPVIYKMEYSDNNTYKVFEKLKFGLVSWPFTYTATVKSYYESRKIIMNATVLKRITIEMIFHIKETGDHSIVEEEIIFTALWPVRFILKKILKKKHTLLFKNIENTMELIT